MLKIKGLKKKKKGHKKHKNKDDELFKPEELEAYRREHQHTTASSAPVEDDPSVSSEQVSSSADTSKNEEWKKFLALTSGVDDVLKKTQGDLDRIKSTSFFQRVPPPSEVLKQEEERSRELEAAEVVKAHERSEDVEQRIVAETKSAIVEVSDSESGEEDEDDIFDTAYIDAIASGEVKLAYIPESPTDNPDDDIFDTSYAEKAILGPNSERRGKKLVPLGSAVEILTGRVQAPTCAVNRPTSGSRRQVYKERDLLLSSFEANTCEYSASEVHSSTLLDENAPEDLSNEPIDLNRAVLKVSSPKENKDNTDIFGRDILEEFDTLTKSPEDEEDKEFALLATESLAKPVSITQTLQPEDLSVTKAVDIKWSAFGEPATEEEEKLEEDPFDTTFAENILPGQAELKIIEKEILNEEDDLDFNPRSNENVVTAKKTVSIKFTDPKGKHESFAPNELTDLLYIKPVHRDLLGGSNTDLSRLGDQPLLPKENIAAEEVEHLNYSDPFDTSAVDCAALPGSTELKFLERELLQDNYDLAKEQPRIKHKSSSDDDFDPRAFEINANSAFARKVSFDLPLGNKYDLLSAKEDDSKATKPLTPYYERKSSIINETTDPFDTSIAEDLAPGQVELKIIETELFGTEFDEKDDFNPRDEKQVAIAKVVQIIEETSKNINTVPDKPPEKEFSDLLSTTNNFSNKVLTPSEGNKEFEDEAFDVDPFDTSIAANILPGATELKLLESELITNAHLEQATGKIITTSTPKILDREVSSYRNETKNILEEPTVDFAKPLTPLAAKVSFDIDFGEDPNLDPFDTSIANDIGPGPSELRLLESQLIN